jgi:dynein light chain LC8-type
LEISTNDSNEKETGIQMEYGGMTIKTCFQKKEEKKAQNLTTDPIFKISHKKQVCPLFSVPFFGASSSEFSCLLKPKKNSFPSPFLCSSAQTEARPPLPSTKGRRRKQKQKQLKSAFFFYTFSLSGKKSVTSIFFQQQHKNNIPFFSYSLSISKKTRQLILLLRATRRVSDFSFLDTMSAQGNITIKSVDMSPEMQEIAGEVARKAVGQFTVERDIASYIKKEFDQRYGQTWHCIVGTSFGSYVTHETKHFIYFNLPPFAILLWKSG